jgi:hypothetical protein
MELLESKVLDLQAWHQANTDKIRELKDIIGPLERKNLDITNEINQINKEICKLDGDLDEDTKRRLFHDFNKIEKRFHTWDRDDVVKIQLNYVETSENIYSITMAGDVRTYIYTITTRSKKVMDVVRECFTNSRHSIDAVEDDEGVKYHIKRMNETFWLHGDLDKEDVGKSDLSKYWIGEMLYCRYNKDIAIALLYPDYKE